MGKNWSSVDPKHLTPDQKVLLPNTEEVSVNFGIKKKKKNVPKQISYSKKYKLSYNNVYLCFYSMNINFTFSCS